MAAFRFHGLPAAGRMLEFVCHRDAGLLAPVARLAIRRFATLTALMIVELIGLNEKKIGS